MDIVKWLCLVSLAVVSSVSAQSCPGDADECIRQTGFHSFPPDLWQICTISAKQLLGAVSCIERCHYALPDHLTTNLDHLKTSCSAMAGCEDYAEKFKDFQSCYGTEESIISTIHTSISLFNSRLPNKEECLNLRGMRSCMKAWAKSCPYLDYFYRSYLETIENFDLALYICGAENVVSRHFNDKCSGNVYSKIERSCNVACNLAKAETAGDFCNILQAQAACIEAYSRGCMEAMNRLLLPRIDTYSFINQLFLCNITVNGVLAKPIDYNECNFKRALFSCFDIDSAKKVTFKDVQKFVNRDFFNINFCSNAGNKEHQAQKCTKAYWPCITPISRAFERPASPTDFTPSIGTFPLNSWGVNQAYESCSVPPNYKPTMICEKPGYNEPRRTTLPPNMQV